MKLFTYFRSSAAYRVRIALNLKGIDVDYEPVNLVLAEQKAEGYRAVNPQGLIPALELDDGRIISQSLAICEWLDAEYKEPVLIPNDSYEAAAVRAFALSIACDIHPVNNLRLLQYLEKDIELGEQARGDWYRHWVVQGFNALEQILEGHAGQSNIKGPFCFGVNPGLADIFLVPQVFNACRFNVDMSVYPRMTAVDAACKEIPAFINAHPDNQPDNPENLVV